MPDKDLYKGREQTFVKHFFLERYLEKLALKIGMGLNNPTLNYVDGFAGPWESNDPALQDTSPLLAISKLRNVRSSIVSNHRQFVFRCFFIEKELGPFRSLQEAMSQVKDVEVITRNGEFEGFLDEVVAFSGKGHMPFGFFFIDPKGWTGYGMSKLKALFGLRRCEVLINFMTSFIDRFVDLDDPDQIPGFQDLFGDETYREEWRGLYGLDREDAIVHAYCRRLKEAGSFFFVGSAVVLNPASDQTHYHLIYATRHPEGMRVFRDIESDAYEEQQGLRSEVLQEKRIDKTNQRELFGPAVLASSYDSDLRDRYHSKAKYRIEEYLRSGGRLAYDDLEGAALSFPLVSSKVLKSWIAEWIRAGTVSIEGLGPRERALKPRSNHFLTWLSH